jgi:PEP-CTERM motif-containing protein
MTTTAMKSFCGCLCIVLVLLAAQAVRADNVTITGTTTGTPLVADPLGYLTNNFLGPLPVSVSFTYDPNAIPTGPSSLGGISYSTSQPLSFQINNYSNVTSGMGYTVIDDFFTAIPEDGFEIGGFSSTNLIGSLTQGVLFSLTFTDSSDTLLSSDALPATWPGTAGFDEVTVRLEGLASGVNIPGLPAGQTFEFSDTLSNFTSTTSPVPEPSTILLFATGLLGLMGMGRTKSGSRKPCRPIIGICVVEHYC